MNQKEYELILNAIKYLYNESLATNLITKLNAIIEIAQNSKTETTEPKGE